MKILWLKMEKENKEKEKSSAQKEKASRGRVAPDNYFLTSKRKKTSVRLAPPDNLLAEKCPCGFHTLGQLFFNLKKKENVCATLTDSPPPPLWVPI